MRTKFLGVIALGLLTAACGTNQEQRTATGALTGAGIGVLAGGPIGLAIGLGAGAVGGAMMPEDATSIANNLLGREHRAASAALAMPNEPRAASVAPPEASGSSARAGAPVGLVKEAQMQLKDQGFYKGSVDGIVGPQTRGAVRAYQKREGLRQTARLDHETVERMNLTASQPTPPDMGSGSSAPQGYTAPTNASPTPPTGESADRHDAAEPIATPVRAAAPDRSGAAFICAARAIAFPCPSSR